MKNIQIPSIALLLGLFIFACQQDEDPITNVGGRPTVFNLRLTDDPVDADQVNVDIQQVYIFGQNEKDSIPLGANAGVYDLLQLQNGVDTLLASMSVNIDTVKQIRLVLGGDNTVMVDSVLHEMKTPSAQQSGLKIKVDLILSELDSIDVLLDFDAGESVKELGNGGYLLKPVLRVQ